MSVKPMKQDEYVVREMFGCGHGHCLPPGFTHWESGEACIWGHEDGPNDNHSVHLYWRLMLVPVHAHFDGSDYCDSGEHCEHDLWERICAQPDKWCHLPLAFVGLKEGDRLDTR